jgi:hypothetical protein
MNKALYTLVLISSLLLVQAGYGFAGPDFASIDGSG